MNVMSALSHHLFLREQLLTQCPELAEDETALADTLEGISDLDQALATVARSIEHDEAMVEGCAKRMDELATRSARFSHRIETKRRLIAETMERANVQKVTLPDMTLSLGRTAPKVIITDETQLPTFVLTVPPVPEPKPNKKAIAELLKTGTAVPGAELSNGGITVIVRRR
jgi:Siphovirus Gp157